MLKILSTRYIWARTLIACILLIVGVSLIGVSPRFGGANAIQTQASQPTPTVDIDSAMQRFEAGGELRYNEVESLRARLVDSPDDFDDLPSWGELNPAQQDYPTREAEFNRKLARCRSGEMVGWVAYRLPNYLEPQGRTLLLVYLFDPYSPQYARVLPDGPAQPAVVLIGLSEDEVRALPKGHRIRFSGQWTIRDYAESLDDVRYQVLPEESSAASVPTDAELADLQIVLDRSSCYGWCPDYRLTIEADGKVTFEGRQFVKVKDIVTMTIDRSKLKELVREFRKADFFSLPSSYFIGVDAPRYIVSLKVAGQSKRIEGGEGLVKLGLLRDRIDQIVGADQWITCPQICER